MLIRSFAVQGTCAHMLVLDQRKNAFYISTVDYTSGGGERWRSKTPSFPQLRKTNARLKSTAIYTPSLGSSGYVFHITSSSS